VTTTTRPTRRADTMRDSQVACTQSDPELWFPPSFTSAEGIAQVETATLICSACPARTRCLEEILTAEGGSSVHYRYGIYAGYTPDERFGIHRSRVRRAAAAAGTC
jgi:hypothetical protein